MIESSIKSNIISFQNKLGQGVTLIAVSKTKPESDILDAYEIGQRDFGENKVQELALKAELLPPDINWHMIGHLQRNKVKYIAPFVHLIHAVDSDRLLIEINKQAEKHNRTISCLLQVHIAKESSKFGWEPNELLEYLKTNPFESFKNIKIKGLMGMATFTNDKSIISSEFSNIHDLFQTIKNGAFSNNIEMEILSTGMTNDYNEAIAHGSNMVRVGTAIFGERNKPQ